MKVTVYPCEKSTFKAVAWYAKHLSPTGMDAYVETIGDSFSLSLNKQVFLLKNISVTPIVKGEPLANRDGHVEIYAELVIEGPLEDDIVTFIETAKQKYEEKCNSIELDPSHVKILTWDDYYWCDGYKTPKRTSKSIHVPEFQKVVDDLKMFYQKKERYTDLEIPYTRTYMLHGIPGTGKSSMIYTIASELNKNLAIIDFSDKNLSDKTIRTAMYKMPKDTILCLEDIDSLFSEDRKSDKPTITFSGILNILDGVVKNTGLVIFMTTNTLKNMDDAAMRRRVDYYVKFDVMKKEQVLTMIQKFFPLQDSNTFYSLIKKLSFTPCVLQKFFVRHLDSNDITEYIDEFNHMCTHDYKLTNSSDALYT